jgi:hypothetical protein
MKGRRITTLNQLAAARDMRQSVVCPWSNFASPTPAAFMIHLSGSLLHRAMENGMWVYKPMSKKRYGTKGR